ncbi:4663_t:CDS:2, partial [Paraglomus brasilianum]
ELPVSVGEKLCQLFDEVTDRLSPIKDIDSKDELDDRSKMRRSNSTDFSDRYRPYEKSNRTLHNGRVGRERLQNTSNSGERSRLFRDMHTRNYSRTTHNSGTTRDYVSFSTLQGYTNIPQRAWQTFDSRSPFYDQVTNANRRPFHDRGGRR